MSADKHYISIWFFIGSLLSFYGILILGVGLYHLVSPPAVQVVQAHLHADIWGGAVLVALGLFYFIHFFPRKE